MHVWLPCSRIFAAMAGESKKGDEECRVVFHHGSPRTLQELKGAIVQV